MSGIDGDICCAVSDASAMDATPIVNGSEVRMRVTCRFISIDGSASPPPPRAATRYHPRKPFDRSTPFRMDDIEYDDERAGGVLVRGVRSVPLARRRRHSAGNEPEIVSDEMSHRFQERERGPKAHVRRSHTVATFLVDANGIQEHEWHVPDNGCLAGADESDPLEPLRCRPEHLY